MAELSLASVAVNIAQTVLFAIILLISVIYLFLKSQVTYWTRRGIPGPKPIVFFGHYRDVLFLKCTEAEVTTSVSRQFPDEKYVGVYHLWKPLLIVKDLDMMKTIMEKDFEHFTDHPIYFGFKKTDAVFNSLFAMLGDVWKTRRLYFSKLFTPKWSKEYAEGIVHGVDKLVGDVETLVQKGEDVEFYKTAEPYAIYSVTNAMYGLNILNDPERTARLKKMTHFFMHPPPLSVVKFMSYGIYPRIMKAFKVRTLPTWHYDYCNDFIQELKESRSQTGFDRPDCFTMIMKLMEEGSPEIGKISYEEVVGHVYSFMQAGTHTTQSTLCHVLYCISQHPSVQEKLRKEVDEVLMESKGKVTYEVIEKMPYLDNIVRETQRLNPLMGTLKRTCTKEYVLDDKLTIPVGMDVYLDAGYVHMNPKYFPDPEQFKPERWNTGEAERSAFMGFGRGPRKCIGKRLAQVEMKMAVTALISRFVLSPSPKMKPMKFNPQTIFITNIPLDGFWIKVKPREDMPVY